MKKVLEGIKSIPGVTGGFFYDSVRGVQEKNLLPLFNPESLAQVGQVLGKMHDMGNTSLKNVCDLSLVYDESVIIMRRVSATCSLIIFCDPSLNRNLLTMSLNMMGAELERIGSELGNTGGQSVHAPATPQAAPIQVSSEQLLQDSPLSPQLNGMLDALFPVIGPMAQLVFDDALEAWAQSEAPSQSRLAALADIVARDIGDSDKEADYMQRIHSYIQMTSIDE